MRKLLALLICSTLLLADSVGPASGTATGAAWTNPSNVGASDNAYATQSVASTDVSGPLYISSLGFAVPSSSTITGIVATLERKCSAGSNCRTSSADNGKIQLTKTAGTGQGTNKGSATTWTTSDVTETLGSSSDLWGSTWTTTDVNANGFGLVLVVYNANVTSPRTAYVDYMAVTVYYTPNGSGSHRRVVISQTRTARING